MTDTIYVENEKRFISYIFKDPSCCMLLKSNYFTNEILHVVFKSMCFLQENNIDITIENLLLDCNKYNAEISYFDLQELKDFSKEKEKYEDIKFVSKIIKDNYIRSVLNKKLIEDILFKLKSHDELDVSFLRKKIQEVDFYLSSYYKDSSIKTTNILVENYEKTLNERRKGIRKRTLGFRCLDEKITKPAFEKQITLLVSCTGGAKSLFTKTIENILINKGVPVLSINPEMDEEQTMDRFMCFRENLNIKDIVKKDQSRKIVNRISNSLSSFKNFNNYLFVDDTCLYLSDVSNLILQAKEIFRDNGTFKEDEYIFVTIDLLSMIRDFEGADYQKIIDKMDILHEISRKQSVHFFCVLQANDRKIKEKVITIRKPEDVHYLKIGLEDVQGGNSWNQRARVIMSLTRPVELKRRFFPERMEEWNLEQDIINLHGIKQNEGSLFFLQFIFHPLNFRIFPFINTDNFD